MSRGSTTGRSGARLRGWFVTDRSDARPRSLWMLLAVLAMAVVLSGRLVDVQLRQGPHLAAAAAQEHAQEAVLHAHRGRILDRSGRLLASDVPVYAVFADPGVIGPNQRQAVATALAPILGIGPSRLADLLDSPGRFVYLAHHVSVAAKQRLDALSLDGIGTQPEEERVYAPSPVPGQSFAANLLGFVDHDGNGRYGVEAYYDRVLRGTDGLESTLRDLAGNAIVLSHEQRRPARNGSDLQLGLDSQIQYWAEQAIAQQTVATEAESGEILVMDPHTGSIRAWAQYPSYDANHYSTQPIANFRDRAISDLYEPGSVMKVLTFAGALDRHLITPQTVIDEQQTVIDGYLIHDWDNRSHGRVSLQWVLDDSLNNGAIQVMRMMGHDAFYENLLRFGVGSPTGIDLAGEVNQPLRPQSTWSEVDYATASFGQQVQVTPVEMLAAVNAVANDGVWVQPHAVDAIIDPTTGKRTEVRPLSRQVMSPDAARTLQQMMTGVVEDQGASGFLTRIPAFKGLIAGKTGTASVAVGGRYGQDVITSFIGFAPVGHPQYTMFVVLRKPHRCSPACEGAYQAVPVFKQMTEVIVDAWKIVPR